MTWVVSSTYLSLVERTLKFKNPVFRKQVGTFFGKGEGLVGKGDTNFKRCENHTTCIKTQEESLRCIQVVRKSILNATLEPLSLGEMHD
jgi:hypothetical protein